MRRQLVKVCGVLWALGVMAGCSGNGNNGGPDAGLDASDTLVEPIIKVSGTAQIHPAAVSYLTDAGLPVPSLEGLTLRVEEPLLVAFGDPNGIFDTFTLTSTGEFSADNVDTAQVSLGIAGGMLDERDAGTAAIIRTATVLFDTIVAEGKPEADIAGAEVYALPTAFHDKLTELVTPQAINALNLDGGYTTLIGAGFILGRVVDDQGNPVAGATIEPSESHLAQHFFYPDVGLTTVSKTATSANGLFIFVNKVEANPDTPTRFTFEVKDQPEYVRRNGGAKIDSALIITVFPGRTAP